jgi:peptidyl-tRNA hydrolase, PTH1 family
MPKLVIGLGNPGKEYAESRHNAGCRLVEYFQSLHAAEFGGWSKKFEAKIAEGRLQRHKVILILPQTYMNESGVAVGAATNFWKVADKDIVIVYDDLDLPLGAIRVREQGSAGGHKGVASVLKRLGTQKIVRLRIGIGSERAAKVPAEDYVLEKFSPTEKNTLDEVLERAGAALESILIEGTTAAMNKFN